MSTPATIRARLRNLADRIPPFLAPIDRTLRSTWLRPALRLIELALWAYGGDTDWPD